MDNMTNVIKCAGGGLAAVFTYLYGGFDVLLSVLLAMVVIDYVTGILAAVYNKTLSSGVGYRGIIKKVGMLLVVAVAHIFSVSMGIAEIRSLVIGFYIANEGLSILENIGKMGVVLPEKLREVLEQLRGK